MLASKCCSPGISSILITFWTISFVFYLLLSSLLEESLNPRVSSLTPFFSHYNWNAEGIKQRKDGRNCAFLTQWCSGEGLLWRWTAERFLRGLISSSAIFKNLWQRAELFDIIWIISLQGTKQMCVHVEQKEETRNYCTDNGPER